MHTHGANLDTRGITSSVYMLQLATANIREWLSFRERVSHRSWMSAQCACQPCKVKAAVSSTGQLIEAVCAVCSLRSFRQQEFLKRPKTAKVSPAMPFKLCKL